MDDDIDGTVATQTVPFALDGVSYEIDLNDTNAQAMRDGMSKWVTKARRDRGGRRGAARSTAAKTSAPVTGVDPKAVRAWAGSNGHKVSDRGRVAQSIVDLYIEAGN